MQQGKTKSLSKRKEGWTKPAKKSIIKHLFIALEE